MKKTHIYYVFLFLGITLLSSCFKDEPANAEADLLKVSLQLEDPLDLFYDVSDASKQVAYSGEGDSIVFLVKPGSDLSAIKTQFEVTPGATVSPASGTTLDFTDQSHKVTVTSEDGNWQRTYTITFREFSTNSYFSFDDAHIDEEWLTKSTPSFYVWGGDLCSANLGYYIAKSSTAQPEDYPTAYSPDGYIGGCAVLQTCDTGFWGQIAKKRIAAGNIYLGTFDITKALISALQATRFGVPCEKKPLRYCGYYKYKAGEKLQDANGDYIEGTDSCAIYAIIYRNKDDKGAPYYLTGEDVASSPLIVGEARMKNIPQTDEWTYFSIDFEYTKDVDPEILKNHGYSFTFVGSASHKGDIFQGAVGSKLWLDEVRIVFDGEE